MTNIKNIFSLKNLQRIFIFLGIFFLIILVNNIGFKVIYKHMARFGFWFLPLIFIASFWQLSHTYAWYLIQKRFFITPPLFTCFRYKIIAEGINMITPTGNIGGDTVRALLIKKMIPLREGVPVVMVDKTVDYFGRMIFIACGLGISLFFVNIPPSFLVVSLVCITLIFLGLILLIYLQIRGFFKAIEKISRFIPFLGRYLLKKRESLRILDGNLNRIYKEGYWRITLALLFHLLGRIWGVLEIFIILRVLGLTIDFFDALFISIITNIANSIFFIVPGQWGVMEGISLLMVKTLGFSPAFGLSLGVIRRLRRLLFLLLGLLFFSFEKRDWADSKSDQ